MPPKKSGKKSSARHFGDVTLNDFANSSVPKNRLKKSSNNVDAVLKQEVEKSWEERDDDGEFEGDLVAQENEDGWMDYQMQNIVRTTQKKTISTGDDNGAPKNLAKSYPMDIWYLLSEYICPESVGRFAGICRTSYEVACTAKFWFSLYRRYYKSAPNMPENLQPECLIRKYGLRANVVRALYIMYQPFVDRIKPITIFEEHPESLKNHECYLLWYIPKSTNYVYYFKMRRRVENSLSHSRKCSKWPDLLDILDDVSANPDEHCRVLEVTCLHFNPVQLVIGMTLKSVSLTLSSVPKFRYHRLQMRFGSAINYCSSRDDVDCITIILDPVVNIKVMDWWHPLYPHNHNMGDLLTNQD